MSIKAIKVTTDRKIIDIDLADDTLTTLQDAVGGYIEAVDLSDRLTMWCNEEGKLIGLPHNTLAQHIWAAFFPYSPDRIVGNVVFIGGVDDDGNTVTLSYSDMLDIHAFLRQFI